MVHDKRIISAILSFAVATAIAGCGKKDESKKGAQTDKTKPVSDKKPPPPPAFPKLEQPLVVEGDFKTPESILYDADHDLYLVSNINGPAVAGDDNGFISKVTPDGKIAELKWIDGANEKVRLNAPKGMAIVNGVLYVADINTVRMFDLASGEPKGEIPVDGATFLNDLYGPVTVAGDDGKDTTVIYLTDTGMDKSFKPSGTDAVYRIADGKVEPVIKGKELGGPNGVVADATTIWVVTYRQQELIAITDGKKRRVVELPSGSLDGIVRLPGGDMLISSWQASAVYRGPATGPFEAIIENVESPADIGYDGKRKRVLIPLFQKDYLEIHQLD